MLAYFDVFDVLNTECQIFNFTTMWRETCLVGSNGQADKDKQANRHADRHTDI